VSAWHDDEAFWATFGIALPQPSPEQAADDIEGFLDLSRLPPGGRALDVGCGRGRHSLALARRGATVSALDLSARQLRYLADVAASENLTIELVRRDMRDFSRPTHFHAALWAGDAVGLFDSPADDLAVVRAIHASLKPCGRLVVAARGKEIVDRDFVDQRWAPTDDGGFALEERLVRDGWERLAARMTLVHGERRATIEASWRLYAGTELVALLRAGGFDRVRLFGGFERKPYDRNAERLVAVAER
jgi:SAM-dependent methyltransferase